MENSNKIYQKIEVLIKIPSKSYNDGLLKKDDVIPTTRLEFLNATLIMSGDYLIVEEITDDGLTHTGRVFNLSEITSYRTVHVPISKERK